MDIDIRILDVNHDLEAFKQIRIEAVQDTPSAFAESIAQVNSKSDGEFRHHLSDHGAGDFVLGAFHESVLIGVAGFYRDVPGKLRHKGHIWGVYVQPQYRRSGIARKLLQTLIDKTKALSGIKQITLTVVTTNGPAVALYESLAFRIYGTETDAIEVDGVFYNEYLMQRLLEYRNY